MILPGTRINTSGQNRHPIRQMQLARFNGKNWELFGELLSD
jgi:branched-chain amino acid transport system substrate-binding protein